MRTLVKSLIGFFYPRLCIVCQNRLIDTEPHICLDCLSLLPRTFYHKQENNRLEEFFAGRFPFERVASFAYFVQGGSIQKIIHSLKYQNNPEIGVYIGELYGSDLKNSDFMKKIDYLIPVPLHPKREKSRGYNQAYEIAKGLSKQLNIEVDNYTLQRVVNNPSQTKNKRFDRWKNVENVFSLSDLDKFSGKHVLLIDDVITTGSTLEACAKELLKANCTISILAIGAAS